MAYLFDVMKKEENKMAVLKAEDMHCAKCVERITKAMEREGLKFEVSLENKTVTIDGDEKAVAVAKEVMDDLGFDTVEL